MPGIPQERSERRLRANRGDPARGAGPAVVLVHAGPLYAYIDADDARHEDCLSLLVEPDERLRIAQLVARYRDLPLGTVDASIVAAAERLGIATVATLDRRHLGVVRPAHIAAFELVP